MYVRKCELRIRWDNYTGEKCKWHTFASRVNLYWMDREKAISPNKQTRKIWDKYAMIEKIKWSYYRSWNWNVAKKLHSEENKKRKKKPDHSNIVSNKYEAEVILREYERMLDKLENTVCYTSDEQAIKDKEIEQLNKEYNDFYLQTQQPWFDK